MTKYCPNLPDKERLSIILRCLQKRLKLNDGQFLLAEMLIRKSKLADWQCDDGPFVPLTQEEVRAFDLSSAVTLPMDFEKLIRAQIVLSTQELKDYLCAGQFDGMIIIDLSPLKKNYSKYLRQARKTQYWPIYNMVVKLQKS